MLDQLRDYQREAVDFGVKAGSFLLADQQGLGKTVEVLATIAATAPNGLYLILTPKVAVSAVWGPEIRRWLPGAGLREVVGTRQRREEALANIEGARGFQHIFVVCNLEMVRGDYGLDRIVWDTVVVDESHRALVRTPGKQTQIRAGMKALRATRKIAVSGTPMRGKPEHLWGTLNWLRPDEYTSYWKWVARYYSTTSNGFSDYVIDGFREGGREAMGRDLAHVMLRRTKEEVLKELPPKSYAGSYLDPTDDGSPHGVWLEMPPKHRKQYNDFVEDGSLVFDSGEELIANGPLAEYIRRRQLASAEHEVRAGVLTPTSASVKFDWLWEKLLELGIPDGDGTGKIVVASQFTRLLEAFAANLSHRGVKGYLLTGKTPDAKRTRIVQKFQSPDGARVFLLNTKAGGVALTLDAADDLVLLDETTIPDDQEQVEDRIHRASRMHNVTIHYLRTLGTIEEEVAWIAAARLDVNRYIMDGVRGVTYARTLYETQRDERRRAATQGETHG